MGDAKWVPWDEAVEHEIDLPPIPLLPLGEPIAVPFVLPAGNDMEELADPTGVVGRAVRERERVSGLVRITSEWSPGPGALVALRVTVENTTTGRSTVRCETRSFGTRSSRCTPSSPSKTARSCRSLDPPDDAAIALAACQNEGTWPVLIDEADTVVLSSPIILYDHPAVAPESPGDLFDATEIDEILALRVLTLTDDEKAEARGTDARAAAIVDRVDDLPPEVWERLHGAVRSIGPVDEPAPDSVPWWDPGSDSMFDPVGRHRRHRRSRGRRGREGAPPSLAPRRRARPLPRGVDRGRRGRLQRRRRRRAHRGHAR